MSSDSKSGKKRKSPGFHLFFDEIAEVLTDKNEVFQIVSEMWEHLDENAQNWYTEEAMKSINEVSSSAKFTETISPGFQLFISEMKSLVVGSDVVEEIERRWKELDDLTRNSYQFKAQKYQQKELKNKKVIENTDLLNKFLAISKRQSTSQVSVFPPINNKKERTNDFEKEPFLQKLLAEKSEEDYKKKTSKLIGTSLKANEDSDKFSFNRTLNSTNNTSDRSNKPPSKSKLCRRNNCNKMALIGQPWNEGFCSEKCAVKDHRNEIETLLEDFNKPREHLRQE